MSEKLLSIGKYLLATEIAASGAAWAISQTSNNGQSALPTPIVQLSQSPWALESPIVINPSTSPIPTETPAPIVTPSIISEPPVASAPEPMLIPHESKVLNEVNLGLGSEPSIAVSPTDPNLVAATYVQINPAGDSELVVISRDGGKTWKQAKSMPMNQRHSGAHARIAFDEQNTLWLENAYFVYDGVSDAIAYSKNLGQSWTVEPRKDAKAWVGRFPDITTDTNPLSPNYGVVAAAYNFSKGEQGSGIRVVVSGDKGKSWKSVDVPPINVAGYPTNWLINAQLQALPDGDFLLSYADTPMKGIGLKDPVNDWRAPDKFMVFPTVLLHYDKALNKLTAEKPVAAIKLSSAGDVEWQSEMGVDKNTGRVWMAVSSYGGKDTVYVGDSDDFGKTWNWQTMGAKGSQNFKPVLTVTDNGTVFVGWHTLGAKKMVSSYYAVSYGDGIFTKPELATQTTFPLNLTILNGDGLREQATAGPDGKIYWAFGIAKNGEPNVKIITIDPGFEYNSSVSLRAQ